MFEQLYFSTSFQDHLILKVVDEAHVIYVWGLVESRKAKHLSSHKRTQDLAFFRPSFGKLGIRLMASNMIPVLLLSATFRPIAIEEIMTSLKILDNYINIIRGEMSHPEIRMIQMPLSRPLSSAEDLRSLFSDSTIVSNEDLPPMLIYSGTQNDTAKVHHVINQARGTPEDRHNGKSPFAN